MYPFRENLLRILSDSITQINDPYFDLPVAENDPMKRERNYCAELYHRIRQLIEEIPYHVTAEPSKKRNRLIEDHCGPVNPDLIIHHPGGFGPEDNLAVIEVKSSDGNLTGGIAKDIETINCMTSLENGYRFGILIIFGHLSQVRRNNLIQRLQQSRADNNKEFFLFLQSTAGSEPQIIQF